MSNVKEFKGTPAPLEVKKENVVFYEIEDNDAYSYEALSPEEKAELAAKNQAFEAQTIQRLLLDRATPCQCQTPRIMERLQAKMKLGLLQPGPNGQVPVELLQEDVDSRQFGIIVDAHDGVYTGVKMVIVKCKGCGDIHFFGDIEAITRMCAEAFAKESDIDAHREASGIEEAIAQTMARGEIPADPDGPAFILENAETGERTPADDLGAALLGSSAGSDEIRTEPVEPANTEPAEE